VDTFKITVRRDVGESAKAWRNRAVGLARREAQARGFVVRNVRLEGIHGGAIIPSDASGLIEVTVVAERGEPGGPPI
jgi:hypothetical protein